MKCPQIKSTRFPGERDQCEHCGRIVYTKADGSYSSHELPKAMQPRGEELTNVNGSAIMKS